MNILQNEVVQFIINTVIALATLFVSILSLITTSNTTPKSSVTKIKRERTLRGCLTSSLMILAGLIGIAYMLIQYLIATETKLYPDLTLIAITSVVAIIGCAFLIITNLIRLLIGTPTTSQPSLTEEQEEEQNQIM